MNNDQRLTTVISFALMLATMALGWFTLSDRLSFPEIATDRVPGQASPSEQDVVARLWEDPLQAVQAEVGRAKDSSGHRPENLSEAVRRKLTEFNGVCLLLVPIPGTPFPDDIETRLRLRHSVQMATPPPAARRLGLQEIKRRVEQERRGAYARWIQDPAFLAMMIPTGLLGVLSVLFQALFGFM